MKYTLFISLLLTLNVLGQNLEVSYTASMDNEILNRDYKNKEGIPPSELEELRNDAEDVYYSLLIDHKYSYFSENKSLENESRKKINLVKIFTSGSFYTKLKTNEVYKVSRQASNILIKHDSLKWSITKESKIVLGKKVYKAIHIQEKNVSLGFRKDITTIAWFAPSIPINTGPDKYVGLPGLILEVFTSQGLRIKATKIKENNKEKDIEFPDKTIVTYQEFVIRLDRMRESFRN